MMVQNKCEYIKWYNLLFFNHIPTFDVQNLGYRPEHAAFMQ